MTSAKYKGPSKKFIYTKSSFFWRIEIFCDQIEFAHSDIDLDFASYSPSVIPSEILLLGEAI